MVRYIEWAQVYLTRSELYLHPEAEPSTVSSTLIDVYWGKMVKKKNVEVIRELSTLKLPPRESLDDRG